MNTQSNPNPVRQKYLDLDASDLPSSFDFCQLKYDGWWNKLNIQGLQFSRESDAGRLYADGVILKPLEDTVLIGEHMYGTQWSQHPDRTGHTFLFDVWKLHGQDLTLWPYSSRYIALSDLFNQGFFPDTFHIVKSFPISSWSEIWKTTIESFEYEGIVFRHFNDLIHDPIGRYKLTITETLTITGFYPGKPGTKYENCLGGVETINAKGVKIRVGGGWSDNQRRAIWNNKHVFLNRKFDASAKARFASGSLRHPNFLRWRDDHA